MEQRTATLQESHIGVVDNNPWKLPAMHGRVIHMTKQRQPLLMNLVPRS
jgi:hypothetical protein